MDDQPTQEENVTIDSVPVDPVPAQEPQTETPQEPTQEEKPPIVRNEKGQFVEGNKEGPGRPCTYCENVEKYQGIADDYMTRIITAPKPEIPWVEELALEMEIDDGTLVNWANKKNDNEEKEHPRLYATYIKLKSLQKLRLKQRATIGRFNPHGALYLLNADHKVIQTNKEVLSSDKDEPLKIIITEEKELSE